MSTTSQILTDAVQQHQTGRLDLAEQLYRQILQAEPNHADAWHLLGVVSSQTGRHPAAVECLSKAISLNPRAAAFHGNLANVYSSMGKVDEAIKSFEQALRLKPDFIDALVNLGIARKDQGDLESAANSFRQAIRLKPDHATAHNSLGVVYRDQGKSDEALACYQAALRINPKYADAHNNLGNVLSDAARPDEAIASFQQAVRLKPDFADAHLNLAMSLLRAGNFQAGWPEYEWRAICQKPPLPVFPQPRWDGSPLNGKTILLHGEQGLGDKLQFIRYAPLVKARGGRVIVACNKILIPILSGCAGIDEFIPVPNGDLPHFDVYAPLLSLPGIFGTTPETIPAEIPYLFADPDLTRTWREKLQQTSGFKVGIVWQGSNMNTVAVRRSMGLKHFAPLSQIEGIQLFSLQRGDGTEQLAELSGPLQIDDFAGRLDAETGAFMDTAAVMMNLDLVITADTSVAHLAGGLGVPVWVALPFVSDWRWFATREDTPWYPTMRLFRQTNVGDWEGVFERIAEALQQQVAARRPVASQGSVFVETSIGELVDKITILEIKSARISDPEKLKNVRRELETLTEAFNPVRAGAAAQSATRLQLDVLVAQLKAVNEALWQI
ncbi:MAG: tetratricopeptide repeat-containing glycosyltransferase family protein, partial [Planctomycetota bacterium]